MDSTATSRMSPEWSHSEVLVVCCSQRLVNLGRKDTLVAEVLEREMKSAKAGEEINEAHLSLFTVPFFMVKSVRLRSYVLTAASRASVSTAISSIQRSILSLLNRHLLPTLEAGILPL